MNSFAAQLDRPIFRRPSLPKFTLEDVLQYIRWSNDWPKHDDDAEFVQLMWWRVRVA